MRISRKMGAEKDLDFGMKCVKYMLFTANLMFVMVGFLLMSIGYTVKCIYKDFEEFMESNYYSPSSLAIAVGIITFIVALFGCIGAIKESTCLVNTYAFFLSIILVLELSICIAAYSMRHNIESQIKVNMQEAMRNYDDETYAFTWNATQYNLQCCGVHGPNDWNPYANYSGMVNVTLKDNSTLYIPETCCVNESCTDSHQVWANGCLDRLTFIVSQCALLLGVGALSVSFIQIMGIVFAHLLAKSIRKLKTTMLVQKEERRRQFYNQMMQTEKDSKDSKVIPILYANKTSTDA